jgi:hypothetical protein
VFSELVSLVSESLTFHTTHYECLRVALSSNGRFLRNMILGHTRMTDFTMDPTGAGLAETAVPSHGGPSWQEQDVVLREMWGQNKSPQEIADALSRSIPAIMTRAARLGLPRRSAPGRKPGQRTLSQHGMTSAAPRRVIPRQTSMSADILMQTSLRICLMCLKKFESAGRHNRICSSCKNSAEYETASALPNIHLPTS